MDKIKVRFDAANNTLIVWFDAPEKMAYLSPIEEESSGDLFLIKDDAGRVIGLEAQFWSEASGSLAVEVETTPVFTHPEPQQ